MKANLNNELKVAKSHGKKRSEKNTWGDQENINFLTLENVRN